MGKKLPLLIVVFLGSLIFFLMRASTSRYQEETYTEIIEYNSLVDSSLSDTISIMSYNIGFLSGMTNNEAVRPEKDFFQNNLHRSIELVRMINPDLISFQEIDFTSKRTYYQNQFDSLGKYGGYLEGGKAVNWDKRYIPFPYWPPTVHYGRMLSGQGLLSKYPINKNERIVLDKPLSNPFYYNAFYIDRLIQISEIEIKGQTLLILNVHLEAYKDDTRRLQANVLLETFRKYTKDYPVILIGDFNAEPEYDTQFKNTIIRSFNNEPGLNSAITRDQYLEDPPAYYTFSSVDPNKMIDYIFYNERIEPISSRVIMEADDISDHLPVLFKFKLKDDSQD